MDKMEEYLSKISIETSEIKITDIQDILKIMEKNRNKFGSSNEYIENSCKVLKILWHHMETGLAEFDDQLLCSTCFYAILLSSDNKEHYLEKVLQCLNNEINLKENGVEVSDSMCQTISLSYGIFQSSLLTTASSQHSILVTILEKIFTLLTLMAYEYSQYTFITFKIMTFLKKAVGTPFQNIVFNKDHNFKLLNVINHNWENPINGVRGLNKIVFHNLISVVDEVVYELIEQKINGFYWNKAKYLMLAEIIECSQSNINVLLDKYGIMEGLMYSLKKAGLVSAGADMYVAILKKLIAEEDWCTIFLSRIIEIVNESSIKPIENFNNYWCLNTLKKFPSLSKIIFDEIQEMNDTNHKMYSSLCIIQQSNRLGLLEKYFIERNHIQELVLINIDHSDVHVRVVSFDIMCGLYPKFLPNQEEYDLILDFMKNNVNSDSSILRLNMIKSFQNFLIQLHKVFVNNKNKDCDIENLITFCKELQLFIIESLNFNGNYQRKIATLQIMKVMLTMFKEIPRKKQRGPSLQENLLDFIKSRNQWILFEKQVIFKLISLLKDPSDDIREHVKDILLNNYSEPLCKSEFITLLSEEGLLCMKSKFFYQITCGHTIFKLILNILLIENCSEGRFKKVEDVFDFAFNEMKSECDTNFDIVKSIVDGKQLHSFINILHSIFEVSLVYSYELDIPISAISSLMEILKNISNQFAWEQEISVSSDFSKMNDMVQKMIESSEYKIQHQFDETNISGLHQIVLNCLWLNVKASCELSSILIRYYKNASFEDVCKECVELICNVLETSRHKGAIEAGGTALGQAVQQLTSLSSSSTISKIPMLLLKSKLKQLVLETNNMASVTRRGAGLSIMIHRIVSSDMKKGRPLFHYFMQTLLKTCNKLSEDCNYDSEVDTNNEKDLPQAIYMHFLTRIVIDSGLASDMMYYLDKLAKLAFDNLSSSSWQIRNAALQLYGSLIPKIIGQKKNSGASDEVMATVAVDEFRTHSPKLWEYIQIQLNLSTKSNCDVVQCHNNLVPILSILANIAPYYGFIDDMHSNESLLSCFMSLLGSPIFVVRRLVSKCILNIYPSEVILEVLLSCTCKTENSLHGTLVLLNEFNKQYNVRQMEKADTLKNKFKILVTRKCSYLSRERFENAYPECINLTVNMLQETLSEINVNTIAPGLFLWANFRIQLYLESAPWDEIPQIVTLIADCCNFETYCEILCKRIKAGKFIQEGILLQLINYLYSLGLKRNRTIIWRTLYELSLHSKTLRECLDASLLYQYVKGNEIFHGTRYVIAFAARVFRDSETEELLCLSSIIFKLCHPETDVDMRLIAVTANNELASRFQTLSDSVKINLIKSAIMFLQDEDEDVRNLSVHFYRKVNKDNKVSHPYICWRKILTKDYLHKLLNNSDIGIKSICNELLELLKSLHVQNEDGYNPFANDSKNVYLESGVFEMILCDLKAV